jgi:hypothetical protein
MLRIPILYRFWTSHDAFATEYHEAELIRIFA